MRVFTVVCLRPTTTNLFESKWLSTHQSCFIVHRRLRQLSTDQTLSHRYILTLWRVRPCVKFIVLMKTATVCCDVCWSRPGVQVVESGLIARPCIVQGNCRCHLFIDRRWL